MDVWIHDGFLDSKNGPMCPVTSIRIKLYDGFVVGYPADGHKARN